MHIHMTTYCNMHYLVNWFMDKNKGEKMKYIDWVGGSIVYEGENIVEAKEWKDEYVDDGYDDVIIEKIKEKK